jgi:hypothetical protein
VKHEKYKGTVVVSRYHLNRAIALLMELQNALLARARAADGSQREALEDMLGEVQQLTNGLIVESKYLSTRADVDQHRRWAEEIINTLRGLMDKHR